MSVVSNSHFQTLRECKKVKLASIEWAIVKAIRDVRTNSVPNKPYEGWALKEERTAYIKKVNELRSKHEQ